MAVLLTTALAGAGAPSLSPFTPRHAAGALASVPPVHEFDAPASVDIVQGNPGPQFVQFVPPLITITTGSAVQWTNLLSLSTGIAGAISPTLASPFVLPPISPGDTAAFTFTQAGLYVYLPLLLVNGKTFTDTTVFGYVQVQDALPTATPTDTTIPPTPTATDTPTDTPTGLTVPPTTTATDTPTTAPGATDTPTPSLCAVPFCPTPTSTPTDTPTSPTATDTATSPAATPTNTDTPTDTPTSTATATVTNTSITGTPSATITATPTSTAPTNTSTSTALPTATSTTAPPPAPTNTSAPPAATPTTVRQQAPPPAPPSIPTQPPVIPTQPTSPVPPTSTATPVRPAHVAPPPLAIHVPVHGVVSGGQLLVVVNTAPHAQVSVTLQVLGTRVSYHGKGKQRKKTIRTVTLYQVQAHGIAARGVFTARLHVTYAPAQTVQARLSVTARNGHAAVTHGAMVPVLPRFHLLLAPDQGASGSHTLISGSGFGGFETIHIKLSCASATCGSRVVLATIAADSHGDFSNVRVTIPGTTVMGRHEIGAIGKRSHTFAWANFTVTKGPRAVPAPPPPPTLTLAPNHGAAGSKTLVSGHGFAAHETVRLTLTCAARCDRHVVLAAIVTDAHGGFSNAHITIPATAARGAHTIGAVGKTSKRTAAATFNVTRTAPRGPLPPALLLAPNHGLAGMVTLASGHGFAPHETVRLKLYCSALRCQSLIVLATFVTDAHGGFSNVRVAIPLTAPRGGHAIAAIGMASNRLALARFIVTGTPPGATPPGLALVPNHGLAGMVTLASGHGFAPHETVRLKLYCSTPTCQSRSVLAAVVTDAQGTFKVRVIIPPKTSRGTHAIGALGKISHRFTYANFTVI